MIATGQRRNVSALAKNRLSLVFSAVGSAGLGFAFWLVSAHVFTSREVGIVGAEYLGSGAVTLQLFALSLPFIGVSSIHNALSLIERQTWAMTYLEAFGAAVFIGCGVLLMPRFGASALGLTFLISYAVVALAMVPGAVRRYLRLAFAGPTVVFRVDLDAEVMATETHIPYPLFVALNPERHPAEATTAFVTGVFDAASASEQTSQVAAFLDNDDTALTEPNHPSPSPSAGSPTVADEPTVPRQLYRPGGVMAPDEARSFKSVLTGIPNVVES